MGKRFRVSTVFFKNCAGFQKNTPLLRGKCHYTGTTNGLSASPSNHWAFIKWSDGVTNNSRWIVTPTNTVSYTANYSSLTAPTLTGLNIFTNQMGFTISGVLNQTVVVEACTNLTAPVWVALQTNALVSGPAHFNDSALPRPNARYYRLRNQ